MLAMCYVFQYLSNRVQLFLMCELSFSLEQVLFPMILHPASNAEKYIFPKIRVQQELKIQNDNDIPKKHDNVVRQYVIFLGIVQSFTLLHNGIHSKYFQLLLVRKFALKLDFCFYGLMHLQGIVSEVGKLFGLCQTGSGAGLNYIT